MNRKLLFLCGLFSPLVYIAMTVIGGAMRLDYSHIYHAVSELLEVGAPNKFLMDILLTISDILSLLFSIGVLLVVKESHQLRPTGMFGAYCLITVSILGLLTALFFPMDPRHDTLTFPGLMHLVIVSVLAILSVLTPVILAIWLKKQTAYTRFGTFSYISAIVILVTGGLAAASAIVESPLMGLAERLTVIAYFQWTFFLALKMYKTTQ